MTQDMTGELLRRVADEKQTSSWAVWDDDDISFPPEPKGLHSRYIVIAGNRGDAAAQPGRFPWANFHTGKKHNDHLLAHALRDTPVEGGFMTDFLSQIETRLSKVDRGREAISTNLKQLVERLKKLQPVETTFVLVGGDAMLLTKEDNWSILCRGLGLPEDETDWVHIPHYSGANAAVHRSDPAEYRRIVAWALEHPRVQSSWRDAGFPARLS